MKIDFSGQTALVTGATRGIGRQVAADLADLGARVLVTGTDQTKADQAAAALAGRGHRGFAVDFGDAESCAAFLSLIGQERRVDVLVNNAGINRINPIDRIRDEDWAAVQRVNLEGPLKVTRLVAQLMKAHRYGRIVNVASVFGIVSKEQRALYSMTKFGLRGLTVATALDLARHGVLANSIAPGFVRTDLTDRILSVAEQAAIAAQIPLGRFADPEEISRVIVFLASSANSYITAQTIIADGGFVSG